MFYSWGKIKTYSKIKHIEALEKYTSGTNLFIIDDDNNILRKSEEIILRSKDDYLVEAKTGEELHNLYYDYLFKEINNMNYLDFSREVYYHNNDLLTFLREEETDQGIYGVLTSTNPFSYSRDELVSMRIMDRDRNIEFEIQEQIDDKTLKVLLLTHIDYVPESYTFNDWSFNKNILDGFDNTIYRDGTAFTIVGDGFSYEHIEIKDGKIQLPIGIYIGHFRIGYNYNALIKTMALGGQIDSFNTMIAKKNILKVFFRLYNSWGGKYGTNYYNLKEINYLRLQHSRYSEPYTLEDQDIKLDTSDKWEYTKYYYIIQDKPYPFNINSITLMEDQN